MMWAGRRKPLTAAQQHVNLRGNPVSSGSGRLRAGRLKILSIGTISEPGKLPRLRGKLPMATSVTRLFMAGHAHSALGTAKIITGDVHDRKAIWRIDQVAPEGRYTLDNAACISEMRDRAFVEARDQLPELRRHFFGAPADEFHPFHRL